ncbi:MAG: TonB-dependent receptor, partial [Opitutus sp.]
PSTYYGNPTDSHVRADVNIGFVTIEHQMGAVTLRNHTSVANYDRGYQNFVPGAVTPDQSQVTLTAYNNATDRTNLFNQTDFTYLGTTGSIRHTVLFGGEIGRQLTDNFRNTGFFNNVGTSMQAPFGNPTISTPVTFRQSATDADNHLNTDLAAVYAQDQLEFSPEWQAIVGLRFDSFDLEYHNNRNGDNLSRKDDLVSPRAGLIYKPVAQASVYANYSVSYLPSSGDQFSSLTTITQQVKPEKFTNYELGAKWEITPQFSTTAAVYRLDRTNTRATDPADPTRIIQTGRTRTNGYELGVTGSLTKYWSVSGGYG